MLTKFVILVFGNLSLSVSCAIECNFSTALSNLVGFRFLFGCITNTFARGGPMFVDGRFIEDKRAVDTDCCARDVSGGVTNCDAFFSNKTPGSLLDSWSPSSPGSCSIS